MTNKYKVKLIWQPEKRYLELLPTITVSFHGITVMWLFFGFNIDINIWKQ